MAIAIGTRLGPYEIVAAIGAGGMGEVYKARDTRLDRTVAIKILREHLSQNAQSRERFEREARAVSSLSHQNICTLHDVGREDGVDFLVMEYLEGETLAERLQKGPLPLDRALHHSIEIATALSHAHRHGVIHRDLKPGNIMLTSRGAKLLDFGLAKVHGTRAGITAATQHSVETTPLTDEGTILGTMQYMAPEQLEGKEADARTDLFAFGAVLYEMITGRLAFQGSSPASLIAAIMSTEPAPLCQLHKLSPPALEHVVKTCLIKNPDERRQAAHDVALELKWIAGAAAADAVTFPGRDGTWWRWTAAGLLLITLFTGAAAYFAQKDHRTFPMTFTIPPPEKTLYADYEAVSPDGRYLVFTAVGPSGQLNLWLRPLDSLKPVPIPGTEGASQPFWSPDGRFVAFFADRKIKKVSVQLSSSAAPVQILADAPDARGGTWSPDGSIVFAKNIEDGLYRVPASGGEVTGVTTLDRAKQENSHRWPQFFPDGRHLLYLARSSSPEYQGIYVGTPGSRDWKLLLRSSTAALVAGQREPGALAGLFGAPRGYLLLMRDRTLLAQPFDLQGMKLMGEPSAIAESLTLAMNRAVFSVAADLILTYRTDTAGKQPLRWFDRTGKPIGSTAMQGGSSPRFSLDGKQVAFSRADLEGAGGDVWLEDLTRGVVSRLTSHPAYDWIPIWSPDGNTIVFASNRGGVMDLYEKRISGSQPEREILKSDKRKTPTDWSRDGQFVFFQQEDARTKWDLWVLPMHGERKPFPILQSEFNETFGTLSPDGKWLAYTSDETGNEQVYVRHFLGRPATGGMDKELGGKWRISTDGGKEPRWRADGKELFYLNARNIMSTTVRTGQTFEASIPVPVFASSVDISDYDVTPDGRRFLVAILSWELRGSEPVTVVSNWNNTLR